ncbi:ubiquinol cytochrome c reductase subunit qcr9 [Phytophthora cinnamomi]|uniref:ubiquinol cytochrome c reductase subunit qcr9 n=1 Tax=Phytophthora cinnamomi TaxID=4785 RepID=UPI00355A12E4|nr:ubiquinol cytochrome c reductase subunit qcr9 [Phytophthora cinnamomi]
MLSRTIRQVASQAKRQGARMASTKRSSVNGKGSLDGAYKLFMKSTPVYVTTVLIAALVVEGVYGSATNYIWEANNRGRLYHHIDWSKFAEEEEEEEDEEEEEEEEEEEDAHEDDEDDE